MALSSAQIAQIGRLSRQYNYFYSKGQLTYANGCLAKIKEIKANAEPAKPTNDNTTLL